QFASTSNSLILRRERDSVTGKEFNERPDKILSELERILRRARILARQPSPHHSGKRRWRFADSGERAPLFLQRYESGGPWRPGARPGHQLRRPRYPPLGFETQVAPTPPLSD